MGGWGGGEGEGEEGGKKIYKIRLYSDRLHSHKREITIETEFFCKDCANG